jgi:hypothetical protein
MITLDYNKCALPVVMMGSVNRAWAATLKDEK